MTELRKITSDNFKECISLEPNENQKSFVASNISSLAEAYVALMNKECVPMPYAVYEGGTMVGFVMLAYNGKNEKNDESAYWIWRLMIDKRYQKNGYGRETMNKVLELIRTFPYGESMAVYLSYEPDNEVAKALYASFGFVETGEFVEGEIVARLFL